MLDVGSVPLSFLLVTMVSRANKKIAACDKKVYIFTKYRMEGKVGLKHGAFCGGGYAARNMCSIADFKHGDQHVKSGGGRDVYDRGRSQQEYIQRMAQTQMQTLTPQYNALGIKETWAGDAQLVGKDEQNWCVRVERYCVWVLVLSTVRHREQCSAKDRIPIQV
jgi:hypothetical protein